MRRKKAYLFILLSLIPALAIPRLIRFSPLKPHVRIISLKAKKCGDSPGRIVVNKGDTAILKPTSLDVVHGFLLDGYPVDAILKQQGLALLKTSGRMITTKSIRIRTRLTGFVLEI
jgi:hypothetical protein